MTGFSQAKTEKFLRKIKDWCLSFTQY